MANITNEKIEIAQISCILFKKYFLDNREGITNDDFEQMKQSVLGSIDFNTQPMLLLKTKGEVISKIFSLLD